MKKSYKTGIIILLIIIISIIAGYMYLYKPHPDYANLKPDFKLNAEALFNKFRNDPDGSATMYNGKMIEITGKPDLTEEIDTMLVVVYIFDQGLFGDEGIRCSVLPEFHDEVFENIEKDFKIKGYCVGYNETDVILEKCSVSNN